MPSEISQTEKDKYCITYMWNLKKHTPQTQTQKQRVVAGVKGGG